MAKLIFRILSILSIACLAWLSVFMLLNNFPWVAGFVTYVSVVVSVQLTSAFWGRELKKFWRVIAVAQMISIVEAWNICFPFFDHLRFWRDYGYPYPPATGLREAYLGSLPGFLALLILLLVTWAYLYIKIRSSIKRPNS